MAIGEKEIIGWLREERPERLERLWERADRVRRASVGDSVHLRGLVEISNHCRRQCWYCGLRAANATLARYRMNSDEIVAAADQAVVRGYGTVVLQSGEDRGLPIGELSAAIRRIKQHTPLAVTLSLGELDETELASLRAAGADRYLLRFETSNRDLYDRIHPPVDGAGRSDRIAQLAVLRRLGFELGSGVMIGIPGQSIEDLARDIRLFAELDLDMIGVGPYVPHPQTPLYDLAGAMRAASIEPVAADALTAYKVIALSRLACPKANIPCTTALATIEGPSGYAAGLARGANVIMPNLTPAPYRGQYEIYPNKAGSQQTADHTDAAIRQQILAAGRKVGTGRGDSPNMLRHRQTAVDSA